MPADINAYALNLELKLSDIVSEAMQDIGVVLEDTFRQFANVQNQVNDFGRSGTQTANAVSKAFTDLNQRTREYAETLGQASRAASALEAVDWAALSPTALEAAIEQYDKLGQIEDQLLLKTARTRAEEDLLVQAIMNREKFAISLEDKMKEITKSVEKESELIDDILKNEKALKKLSIEDLDRVKLLHKEVEALYKIGLDVNGLDKQRTKDLGIALKTMDSTVKKTGALEGHLRRTVGIVKQLGLPSGLGQFIERLTSLKNVITLGVIVALHELIQTQEEFRRTNFRVAGSIRELTQNVTDLQTNLGISSKEAAETVKALAMVGASQEEIQALSEANAMFAKTTGASADKAALLQRRMALLSGSTDDANEALQFMTVMARKSGLTGADLNAVIDESNKMLFRQRAQYGSSEQGALNYSKALVRIAASARAAGADAQEMMRMFTRATKDPYSRIVLLGDRFDEFVAAQREDPARAMELLGASAEDAIKTLDKFPPAIRGIVAQEMFGESIENLEQMRVTAKRMEDMNFGGDAALAASDAFDESFRTIIGQLIKLGSIILGLIKGPLQPFLDALVGVLKVIGFLVGGIADFVGWLGGLLDGLGPVGSGLKWLIKAFIGLTAVVMLAGTQIGTFAITSLSALLASMKTIIVTMWTGFIPAIIKASQAVIMFAIDIGTSLIAAVVNASRAVAGFAVNIVTKMIPAIGSAIVSFVVWIGTMIGALIPALGAAAVATWAFTVALLANPITWIVLAVVALIAVIVLLVVYWDVVKDAFVSAFGWIVDVFKTAWDWVSGFGDKLLFLLGPIGAVIYAVKNFGAIVDVFKTAWDWVSGLGDKLLFLLGPIGAVIYAVKNFGAIWDWVKGKIGAVWDFIKEGAVIISDAFGMIADVIMYPFKLIGNIIGGIGGFIGGIGDFIGDLFGFKAGGIVTAPMIAQVGEVPEAIIPIEKLPDIMSEMSQLSPAKAETISTIKMTEDTARGREEDRRTKQQVDAVNELADKIDKIVEIIGAVGIERITHLLQEYLPQIAEGGEESGLSTPTNQWVG